jgi:hypothetical protein
MPYVTNEIYEYLIKMTKMNNLQSLLKEISQLIKLIETNYPELYQFLDENPSTISSKGRPTIDEQVLQEYFESLKQLLKHHTETHHPLKT